MTEGSVRSQETNTNTGRGTCLSRRSGMKRPRALRFNHNDEYLEFSGQKNRNTVRTFETLSIAFAFQGPVSDVEC